MDGRSERSLSRWSWRYRQALHLERQAELALLGSVTEEAYIGVKGGEIRPVPFTASSSALSRALYSSAHTPEHLSGGPIGLSWRGGGEDLRQIIDEATRLRVLDPACGCGRFLLVAFRALRCLHLWLALCMARLEGGKRSFSSVEAQACERALNCLYGIDISEEAVAAARAVLLCAAGEANSAQPHLLAGDATLGNEGFFENVDVCLGKPSVGGARRTAGGSGLGHAGCQCQHLQCLPSALLGRFGPGRTTWICLAAQFLQRAMTTSLSDASF